MNPIKKNTTILIDGHVHYYEMFDTDKFFNNAIQNFSRFFPDSDHIENRIVRILFFTEGKTDEYFSKFKKNSIRFTDNEYKFKETDENISIRLTKKIKDFLYIIRGRQIITRENIEILHIGTDITIKDGLSMQEVLEKIKERSEIAILAWGVGKWFFGRKNVVRSILESNETNLIFVGDNSARPKIWPTPNLFRRAKKRGIKILNGSDPLPLSGEERKPGSYFFSLTGDFDLEKPFLSLKNILSSENPQIIFHGKRDSLSSFFNRQSRIYLKKYISG